MNTNMHTLGSRGTHGFEKSPMLPCDSDSKESTFSVADLGSTPGLGRSPEEGKGSPLQYSGLENPHGQGSLAVYNP